MRSRGARNVLELGASGTPVRFPGCPECGAAPVSVNAEDHFVDRAERFWHWGCALRRLGECAQEGAASVSKH